MANKNIHCAELADDMDSDNISSLRRWCSLASLQLSKVHFTI